MEVEFNELKYQVLLVDDIAEDVFGRINYQAQTIKILNSLTKEHKEKILVHELTHACLYAHGFSENKSFDQEQLCDFMAFQGINIIVKASEIINKWRQAEENN